MAKRLTEQQRCAIKSLHAAGKSLAQIAREVGCSKGTVRRVLFPETVAKAQETCRQFRIENPEYTREYRRQNPEICRAGTRRRRARKKGAPTDGHTAEQLRVHLAKWRGKCAYCFGSTEGRLHVDHVVPLAKGGAHAIPNLVPACAPCNWKKAASVWRPYYPEESLCLSPLKSTYVS